VIIQQQLGLHDLVASMGGTFAYVFDPSITHLIFGTHSTIVFLILIHIINPNGDDKEGRPDSSKELRLAKSHKHIKIVSPVWLHECKRQAAWVDESEYPHTMNPRMNLGLGFRSSTTHSTKNKEEKIESRQEPLFNEGREAKGSEAKGSEAKEHGNEEEEKHDEGEETKAKGDVSINTNVAQAGEKEEEEDLDFFVPPTQQPVRHLQPPAQDKATAMVRRHEKQIEEEAMGYDVVVGCTPEVWQGEEATETVAKTYQTLKREEDQKPNTGRQGDDKKHKTTAKGEGNPEENKNFALITELLQRSRSFGEQVASHLSSSHTSPCHFSSPPQKKTITMAATCLSSSPSAASAV